MQTNNDISLLVNPYILILSELPSLPVCRLRHGTIPFWDVAASSDNRGLSCYGNNSFCLQKNMFYSIFLAFVDPLSYLCQIK